ncbi:MAG: class III signal peptide-containing protein [Pirellulaceae bacterium]
MLRTIRNMFRSKKGQGLVEYGLIIAGVALICAVSISVFGHKTSDLISAVAAVLPGSHFDDNGPIVSGKLIETAQNADTNAISLDTAGIVAGNGKGRLGNNVVGTGTTEGFGGLILEAN